jgi:hypothetical protein
MEIQTGKGLYRFTNETYLQAKRIYVLQGKNKAGSEFHSATGSNACSLI